MSREKYAAKGRIGENCIEEEKDKSHRELETTVEDIRGQVCPAKIRRVQEKT